jgi:hypothetical protein
MSLTDARTRVVSATLLLSLLAPPTATATAPEHAPPDTGGPADERPIPPADDAPIEERADYWFLEGLRLGQAGDLEAAATAFDQSVKLVRTADGLFNLAQAYEYANRPLDAIVAYEDYLTELEPRSQEAHAIEETIRGLKGRVGTIELSFDRGHVPKQIFVDGEEMEREDFPLLVSPDEHAVVVVERNGERREQKYRLVEGQIWTVDFTRPAEQPVPTPAFRPPPVFEDPSAARRRRATRALFYTSLGLTAASGVSLGVVGGLRIREKRAFEAAACGTADQCEEQAMQTGQEPEYFFNDTATTEIYTRTTNVMIGVTAGLGTVALVLGIVSFVRPKKEEKAASQRLRVGPGALEMRF